MEGQMSYRLPDSPVRDVKVCYNCDRVNLYFLDPRHDVSVTRKTWNEIVRDGIKFVKKHTNIPESFYAEDPKFF